MFTHDLHVYKSQDGRDRTFLSFMPPELVEEIGFPSEAIIGEVTGSVDAITPASFTANRTFIAFLHFVVAKHAKDNPHLQTEAKRVGNGHIHLVDMRSERQPPREDIIGSFAVKNGVVETYEPNPDHRLISERGLFELDGFFVGKIVEELRVSRR